MAGLEISRFRVIKHDYCYFRGLTRGEYILTWAEGETTLHSNNLHLCDYAGVIYYLHHSLDRGG